MSDQEERDEEYKEQLEEGGFPKRDILRKKHPQKKQYCEECQHCIKGNHIEYHKCGADPKLNVVSKTAPIEYFHCVATRTGPRCAKYKGKNQTI